jgi:glycosyltransferase involved in cell wall biosynthesis
MKKTAKVSICMPTYNRAEALKVTIPTILSQKFTDFELIVNDDCSLDNTKEVVESFADSRIKYYRNSENLRMPGNLNATLEKAAGEYIVIFHDHDIYAPDALQEMVAVLDKNERIGIVHPGILWQNQGTGEVRSFVADFPEHMPGQEMLKKHLLWSWGCPVCALYMVRRKCYEELGAYDSQFGFVSDVDMTMRLCAKYDIGYVAKPLITCVERESDHEYAALNWRLPCWVEETHRKHINLFYKKGLSRLFSRLRHFSRSEFYYFKHLLICVKRKDTEKAEEGIAVIRDRCSIFTRIMASSLFCILKGITR